MKTNIYLILSLSSFAILSTIEAKDLHCYFPVIGRTEYCSKQAEIDRIKREAKAEAKTLKREAKAQAETIKSEAREQAKQTITAATAFKKATQAQALEIQKQNYPETVDRHWYNLWRFWDIKTV